MRSESTSALGQPSETNPTFGAAPLRLRCFAGAAAVAVRWFLGAVTVAIRCFSAAFFVAVIILGRRRACGLAGGVFARRRRERVGSGEIREREVAEQVTRLLLHLLLHFEERIGALLEIAAHEALDRRALHFQKLAPRFSVRHRRAAAVE